MTVRVHNAVPWLLPLTTQQVRAALCAMLQENGLVCGVESNEAGGDEDLSLDVYVLRDGAMALENGQHMGCAGPTNVLSFPPAPGGVSVPATLLLSADTLARECLLYGQEPREHMLRLLAHGLAHTLGYDHGPEMDALCQVFGQAGCHACGLQTAS